MPETPSAFHSGYVSFWVIGLHDDRITQFVGTAVTAAIGVYNQCFLLGFLVLHLKLLLFHLFLMTYKALECFKPPPFCWCTLLSSLPQIGFDI